MPVRVLQALDGANGLHVFDVSLKARRSGFEGRLQVRLARTERERANHEHPDLEEFPTHGRRFYLPRCGNSIGAFANVTGQGQEDVQGIWIRVSQTDFPEHLERLGPDLPRVSRQWVTSSGAPSLLASARALSMLSTIQLATAFWRADSTEAPR